MSIIRSRASLSNLILAPHVQDVRGAICMTCGKVVTEESWVEGYPGQHDWFKYLVRHHGAEELRRVDVGTTEWDWEDMPFFVRRMNWFDPAAHEGLGLGKRIVNPNDHDGGDEPLLAPRTIEVKSS